MTITLTPEQQQWLAAQVAAGHFPSIEAAVRAAVADFKAINTDDLSWAKPYIDRALGSVARGEIVTLEEHRARMASRLDAAKG